MWGSPHLRVCGGVLVAQVEVQAVDEHVVYQLKGAEVVVVLPLWLITFRVFLFQGHYGPLPFSYICVFSYVPFKNCKKNSRGVAP